MNSSAAQFCGDCGVSLSAPVAPPLPETSPVKPREVAGERRHLTVLFCHLVGSTEISARLDPEQWRELAADYNRAAAEAVTRFGGYVAKYLGDGVLAYFGWPEAHDNDAERGARAGLAMVDAVDALNRRDGQPHCPKLSIRVGIDSGTVVVGEGGGSESEVFGDTVNIASRVQSAADPDTVLVSAAANRLISGLFVVEERGTRQVKGIAQPLGLYRIVRLSGVRSPLAASAARGLMPFVGREDELRLLMNRWERANDGEGQVVLIVGEAGIGKSRLVRQFRKQLAGTPHTWNECAGAPYFQNTPFYPITEMLQQGFALRGNESDESKLGELEKDLELAGLKLAETVPLIAPMLNIPVGDKYPPVTLSPEQQRKRLLVTLAGWLFRAARAQSIVMAVEDLHWFDASTLDLLRSLVEQGATSRLLLVYTARPEFRARWTLRAHHAQLTLNRLSAHHVRAIVANVMAQAALAGETVETVVERTSGVPLFVEELTRAVLEKGDAKSLVQEIPVTLHDSLMARLDRLGRAKEVAQIGSVIGQEFSYELIAAAASMPHEELQTALTKLANAELIYPAGIPPEATYSFKHALIRDAAYQALLKSRRRELHQRVAVAISEKFPEMADTQPEVLARHYTQAAMIERAVDYWGKAGQKSLSQFALTEAALQLTTALDLISTLPSDSAVRRQELNLQTTLGVALYSAKGYAAPLVMAAFERARELFARARSLGEELEDPLLQFAVMYGLWATYYNAGKPELMEQARQFLALAQAQDRSAPLLVGHRLLGTSFLFLGEFSTALEHLDQAVALYDPELHPPLALRFGQDIGVSALANRAWSKAYLGYPEKAFEDADEALGIARRLDHVPTLVYALTHATIAEVVWRNIARSDVHARELVELSDKHHLHWLGFGTITLGLALANQGRTTEAIEKMRAGLAITEATGSKLFKTLCCGPLADAHAKAGQFDYALGAIQEGFAAVEATNERWAEAELHRQHGELLLCIPSPDARAAEVSFHRGLAVARRQNAKLYELRTSTSLARLWAKQTRYAKARDLLEPVYDWFTEGFDTVDLKDAKALLDELHEVRPARAH